MAHDLFQNVDGYLLEDLWAIARSFDKLQKLMISFVAKSELPMYY